MTKSAKQTVTILVSRGHALRVFSTWAAGVQYLTDVYPQWNLSNIDKNVGRTLRVMSAYPPHTSDGMTLSEHELEPEGN